MGSNYTSGILSPVPNNRNGGSREVPNKMVVGGGGGVWKMFSVKSGYPLSLIMGVPNNYLK